MVDSFLYPNKLPARTIRLLTVETGSSTSPLQTTLFETCLDSKSIPYYALSYVWGANDNLVPIFCNSQILHITPNLYAVLIEYRSRNNPMPLWVDAICINQGDTLERTFQVRMMQEIYSKAECVVVWLGPADPSDEPALELLKTVYSPWATFRHDGRDLPLFTGQTPMNQDAELGAKVPDAYFDALAAFLMRPWFGRIWIVQEVLMASKVTIWCGSKTLDNFPVLEAAARLMGMWNCHTRLQVATTTIADPQVQGKGRLRLVCAGRLEALKVVREQGKRGILYLLLLTRCFDATDSRDKIFALVGLANDVSEAFVDYAKSREEILTQLSRMVLDGSIETDTGCALDLWSCITRDADEELNRPSWVVDFLILKDQLYMPLMGRYPSEQPFIRRKPDICFAKDDDDNELLYVGGTIFDSISHIVPSPICMRQLVPQTQLIQYEHIFEAMAWYTQVIDLVVPTVDTNHDAIYHPTRTTWYDALWRTLCCNRSAANPNAPPLDDSSYQAWIRLLNIFELRHNVEESYRHANRVHKRWFWALSTLSTIGLTYHFRRYKLASVAMPLSLPLAIRWFNKTWDHGLKILLYALHAELMPRSSRAQMEARDFEASFSEVTQGRQFCVTHRGLIGWVPLAARVGDQVGLFGGCRIPFVLRAFQGGQKIVGDAYLHGVMDGEGERCEQTMIRIV